MRFRWLIKTTQGQCFFKSMKRNYNYNVSLVCTRCIYQNIQIRYNNSLAYMVTIESE